MACELIREEAEWTLQLRGVIDVFDALELHAVALEALEHGPATVCVALAGATGVDTTATQILLALQRGLAERGRSLRVVGASARVAGVWESGGVIGLTTAA